MQRQLAVLLLVGLCACALLSGAGSAAVLKRSVADVSSKSDTESRMCYNSTPCGWMVYVPFTRRIDYFMKNTCDCPKGKTCQQAEDDLSVSAYIYRCMDAEASSKATDS
ncbi:uncharacterized protein LOC134534104 [Bacillus rossius redtenbacheri]|uniref:uncharacterized protein LOC134534104 n=1 Tax=Bacillus rossius redtenbacheri TaxID=93214 RepID=UPI002FDEE4FA